MFLSCSIDATFSKSLCRYVNDSPFGNCIMKKVMIDGKPHLCLVAAQNINSGTELRYDYLDIADNLTWREKVSV